MGEDLRGERGEMTIKCGSIEKDELGPEDFDELVKADVSVIETDVWISLTQREKHCFLAGMNRARVLSQREDAGR